MCVDYMLSMAENLGALRKSIESELWDNAERYEKSAYEWFKALAPECIAEEDREYLANRFLKLKISLDNREKEKAEDYTRLISHALSRAQMRMFINKLCKV